MANLSLRQPVANTAPREGYARIHGLHHWAFRCKDADETRHFYEEILGLPLAAAVQQASDEQVVEDIEAAEGEPGGDMQTEERVARDPDCLVVGSEPGGTRDALRHGCLRVGVEACSGKDAGGIDTDRGQIRDEAHDRPDVEFRSGELQHAHARD